MMRVCACGAPSAYKDRRYCRSCYSLYQQKQRARHIDKRRAADRERRPAGMPRSRPNPLGDRDYNLKRTHGISLELYEVMFAVRDGRCDICGEHEHRRRNGVVMSLCVDHDHKTGRRRGLLCNSCNRGLGLFADDPDRLRVAASYLEE